MASNVKKGTGGAEGGASAVLIRPDGDHPIAAADGSTPHPSIHVAQGGAEGGGSAEVDE